jgi:hypothetical protein
MCAMVYGGLDDLSVPNGQDYPDDVARGTAS